MFLKKAYSETAKKASPDLFEVRDCNLASISKQKRMSWT